jgi:hypothetical protein
MEQAMPDYYFLARDISGKVLGPVKDIEHGMVNWDLIDGREGHRQAREFIESPDYRFYRGDFPQGFDLLLPVALDPKARLADVLHVSPYPIAGFVAGPALLAILARHRLPPHRHYPIRLFREGQEVEGHGYHWVYPNLFCREHIDYVAMDFQVKMYEGYKPIKKKFPKITSYDEYHQQQKEVSLLGGRFTYDRLVLGRTFDRELDMFGFRLIHNELYISARLKNELDRLKVKGWRYWPSRELAF